MKIKFPSGIPLTDKGMGIVLVLVVISLVGAATLYLMDVTKVTTEKIAVDSRALSYNQLVDDVRNKMQLENVCKKVLTDATNGGDITGAFNPDGMSLPGSLDLEVSLNKSPLQKPSGPGGRNIWYVAGGTSIRDIILVVNEIVRHPVRYSDAASPIMIAANGYLLIKPGHPGTGMGLARNRNKYQIPILIYYQKVGGRRMLVDCFAPDGDAFACTAIGGTFKSAETITQKRCQPDRQCFPYKAGLTTNASECAPPYEARLIGNQVISNTLGNKLYLCEWCNKYYSTYDSEKGVGLLFYPKNREDDEDDEDFPDLIPSGTDY